MSEPFALLLLTSATIGVVHTLLGPDHYVPFIALARARGWSPWRALRWTVFCGVGHVIGSVALGMIGIAAGIGISSIEAIEGTRGEVAAWFLITFGTLYMAWGIHRALRSHAHHKHGAAAERTMTAWVLFVIFVLGPCEALIPVLMYPAATAELFEVAMVTAVFAIATVATMSVAVVVGLASVKLLAIGWLEPYGHAVAGAVILACGLAIQLGL